MGKEGFGVRSGEGPIADLDFLGCLETQSETRKYPKEFSVSLGAPAAVDRAGDAHPRVSVLSLGSRAVASPSSPLYVL